ncbi:fructose-bisphosphate aldolase class II [Pullulanibacillus pueri]|uniref:Fructose-bisphosphate aldolase n=1 Tax=Pullulanibacillus pueri TaxID=1437324 RepID=A0A8J3EMW3_9BACL|nr:class II fructose-bisphosphate aldolase [Pullulanibacillus pueri]MBM7682916.1 fructose-bisphosphate aldolase class II [Pullulanibacillus pueri]GGH84797.1 fructose-bisphosphate aldolase [Pullulanibacillus pueri]
MTNKIGNPNVISLKRGLETAERGGFAIGSFSPRYTPMIRPILRAGEKTQSPLIVQISQKELDRYHITPFEFAEAFYQAMSDEKITVPVVLHLDHTKQFSIIKDCIRAGFTSVMIDASEQEIDRNIEITKEVVKYAHEKGISVEAELGKIGTTDFVETDKDEELYTDPEEALRFVNETGCDALAVSVGTAHGVYEVRKPKVDLDRLNAIRDLTDVHLVLHGGSGVPAYMVKDAIQLPNGGVSKVNIATDLEVALLKALGREERMTNAECQALSEEDLKVAQAAVEATVTEKIENFLGSAGRASAFTL